MRARPRAIEARDLERVKLASNEACRAGSFSALRTRALVALALGSALRLKECCALDLEQVLDRSGPSWTLRSTCYLRAPQAKGRRVGNKKWSSAGVFVLTRAAQKALRAYLREAVRRQWLRIDDKKAPLFVTIKGRWQRSADHHVRLSRRTAQHTWEQLQKRAQLNERYGFHCLRHTAMTRFSEACNGNPYKLAAFGRVTMATALIYVHTSPSTLAELAELASRPRRGSAA